MCLATRKKKRRLSFAEKNVSSSFLSSKEPCRLCVTCFTLPNATLSGRQRQKHLNKGFATPGEIQRLSLAELRRATGSL